VFKVVASSSRSRHRGHRRRPRRTAKDRPTS